MQFSVWERLRAMRRSLGPPGPPAGAIMVERALVLDDRADLPDRASAVRAQAGRAQSPDEDGTARQRAAVLVLADRVRNESDLLLQLTGRARERAERLTAERLAGVIEDWALPLREVEVLAVDAALAAVRAAGSTRGFSAAAKELADLADGVRMAWETVEPDLVRVEEGAAEVAYVAARLRRLGRRIGEERGRFDRGEAGADPALCEAEAVRCARSLADQCEGLSEQVARLARDIVVLVRQAPVGNRRGAPRVPLDVGCQVVTAGGAYWGRTRDLSRTGALVALRPMPDLHRAQPVTLLLHEIGALTGSIVDVSAGGVHVSFDLAQAANASTRPALLARLSEVEDENEAVSARCRRLADDLTEAFEAGLSACVVTLDDLLGADYRSVEGPGGEAVSPAQTFYAAFVPSVLTRHLDRAAGDLAAFAIDRNGYVPISVTPGHGAGRDPQRGRLATDQASLRAARSVSPSLVQMVSVEEDPASLSRRAVSVPVFIRGRHWGCAMILTPSAEFLSPERV